MGYYPPADDDSSTDRPTDRTAVTDSVADVEPPGDYRYAHSFDLRELPTGDALND